MRGFNPLLFVGAMNISRFLSGSLNPRLLIEAIKYKREFRKLHPEYFDPDGIMVFCGPQGAGKTLSAVQYVIKLAQQYPNMILVTNVRIDPASLNNIKVFPYTGIKDLSKYQNDYAGVVFLIDEIQIEFNSLESKNIDPSVITEIAQQKTAKAYCWYIPGF